MEKITFEDKNYCRECDDIIEGGVDFYMVRYKNPFDYDAYCSKECIKHYIKRLVGLLGEEEKRNVDEQPRDTDLP